LFTSCLAGPCGPLKDSATRVKLQHYLTGVHPLVFLLAMVAFDIASFCITAFPVLALLNIVQRPAFSGENGSRLSVGRG
jgi:hypothetical protein